MGLDWCYPVRHKLTGYDLLGVALVWGEGTQEKILGCNDADSVAGNNVCFNEKETGDATCFQGGETSDRSNVSKASSRSAGLF